ncbi:hypothetical protein GYH30_033289 [Glycine max]|uniref:Uncharacterized protein n=2 Tax=Glycine subgen. Soja TaxID=1462606 RepID=A0A0R0H478_SOYBN|nr:hypothetical protein GYH30_033289 [Glycine max]RZB75223.1 hypothetical protein D0Y65_033906 [Glycine soja]
MARVAGIFLCLLILITDVTVRILGFESEITQNKVKHLRLWIFECREPSHQGFMLGLGAAVLLGLAHAIANLLGGCNCICSQQEILCGIGLSTLVMGSKANKSSEDLCGFSDNHLLEIGGICCFIHCILYYVTHITF